MESTCVHTYLHKEGLIIMEVQIIERTRFTMRLAIRGIKTPFANALRRIMLSEVPAMAIEDVVIIENSSVLHDEILAHRLGFIPIKTDLDSYNLPSECPCKSEFGCNLCRAALFRADESRRRHRINGVQFRDLDAARAGGDGSSSGTRPCPAADVRQRDEAVRRGRGARCR